ncbi:Protein dpy-30 [Trebouxia sp. C0009 RCD-2024]
MAEVSISPSMPGENTKQSSAQEAVPAMGHKSGSDAAPTSAGAIGVDTHLEPVTGAHTAHPDTDMKVKEKTSDASPSAQAMAAIQPPKPNHDIAASVDAAAHGQKVSAGGDTLQELKDMSLQHKSAEDKTPATGAGTPHPLKAETKDAPMVAKSENAHAASTKLDDIGVTPESKDNHPAVAHAVHGVVESAAVPATAHLEDHPVFEPTREYLDHTVVPVLRAALKELVMKRPQDPFGFLSTYITENKPKHTSAAPKP